MFHSSNLAMVLCELKNWAPLEVDGMWSVSLLPVFPVYLHFWCVYIQYIYIYIHTYDLNFMLLILTEFSFDAYLFAISVPPLLASVQDSFYFLIFGIINQWVYIWFNNQIKTTKWNHNYLWLGLRIGRCDLEHPAGMILEVSKLLLKHLLSCLRSSHISITLC
jgi:hypothetical protein